MAPHSSTLAWKIPWMEEPGVLQSMGSKRVGLDWATSLSLLQCMKVKSESQVAQLCPTLCNPMDCSTPGSSIHGILYAKMLDWVAIPFSSRSSWLRDWTHVSSIAGRFFTIRATREAPKSSRIVQIKCYCREQCTQARAIRVAEI